MSLPFTSTRADAVRAQLQSELARAAALLSQRGATPATSGNFSVRLDARRILITRSGVDKGRLGAGDFMLMDSDAQPLEEGRPSAEARLHAQLYRLFPHAGSVLHTHSLIQTVASLHYARDGAVRLSGYELVKALAGHDSHEQDLLLPVFPNSQDMAAIEHAVQSWLDAGHALHGYLIAGHGLYAWGSDIAKAMRHLEAIDFMLACGRERVKPT